MNKLLIGTATAALFVTPAIAGPMAVTVGGYYNSIVYSQDVDSTPVRDLGIHNDSEIVFKGKGKIENGLTLGFQIQLEAEGANQLDHIDENYIYVKGDFGKVEIGAENNAAYKQQVHAPKVLGWKTYDNNFSTWAEVSGFDKPYMDGIDGDALKINYYSPKINGVQISYSVTPDTSDTDGDTGLFADGGSGSATAMGVKYTGTVRGMKVKASYGMTELDEDSGEPMAEDVAIGLSISSGNITVGGTMQTVERGSDGGDPAIDRDILHYGIQYKMSKATKVGLIMHSQEEADGDELSIMAVGGSTKLGAGTTLTYSYETLEDDDPAKGDSTFMGVGLLLKF